MLETIREYGLDQLNSRGEVALARAAHADHFSRLVHTAEPLLRGADQLAWIARLEADQPDVLSALKFLADSGQAQAALQMAVDLAWYWMILGRHAEVATWSRIALDADGPRRPDTALLAQAFHAINAVASGTHARDSTVASHVEELERLSAKIAEVTSEDPPMLVMFRPIVALFTGAANVDRALFDDALASPDPWVAAAIRSFRASVAENEGDVEGMRQDATVSLAQLRVLGDRCRCPSNNTLPRERVTRPLSTCG